MKRLLVFSIFFALLSGCAVSDRVVYEDAEGVVPDNFFRTVKNKKTKKDWIVGNLGQPYAVDEDGQVEFYTYHFSKSQFKKASVLFVLNRGVVDEKEEYYHVMMCNDVVERTWFDEYSTIQTYRFAKKSKCFVEEALSQAQPSVTIE